MAEKYVYNLKRHTLHIEGYCHNARKGMHYDDTLYKCFSTEDEALAYGGRSVGMCKLCLQKREKLLKKESEKK